MHSYSLTLGHAMRDGEEAARSHTSRSCAAHAVHPLRPSGLTGGAMVRRAYRQRSLVEVLLSDADKLWDSPSDRSTRCSMTRCSLIALRRPSPSAIRRVSVGADWG